jgi:hypothetical protein
MLCTASLFAFPLIAPSAFFAPLPGKSACDPQSAAEPGHLDNLGYLVMHDGARSLAPRSWSKRAISDPFDVDLTAVVTYTPTIAAATTRFAVEISHAALSRCGEVHAREADVSLRADAFHVSSIPSARSHPTCVLDSRYGNYLFHFAGRIAPGGYFEAEADFWRQMALLDRHVSTVLRLVAMRQADMTPPPAVRQSV